MKVANLAPLEGQKTLNILFGDGDMPDLEITDFQGAPEDVIAEGVKDVDIILGDAAGKTPITRRIASAAKKTKLIQLFGAGFNGIDLEACRDAGIKVANAPGANAFSVAEHTVMMALMLLKRVMFLNQRTHAGLWKEDAFEFSISGMLGKVFGLLGMGHIGKAVAERLAPFGVKEIFYYKRVRLPEEEEKKMGVTWAGMDEILAKADVVSVHLPLSEETEGIMGTRELAMMKKTAILINVSRGGVVDEEALAQALREKEIAGAGLDVFISEPITKDCPFLGLENVILTPHTAGASPEAHDNIKAMAAGNILNVIAGKEPKHVINE